MVTFGANHMIGVTKCEIFSLFRMETILNSLCLRDAQRLVKIGPAVLEKLKM
jgi:hypothetical protein